MMTNEHKAQHVTPKGRSVFRDLFPEDEAAELEIRSVLLMGLSHWLRDCGMTQTAAAGVLGVTQARVSEIKHGKINQFSLDMLVKLASRAGLHPRMQLDVEVQA
jgi:predicted XRE-type DNA-binding protein